MITIFACPRHFRGHFDVIQRNAIKSWTLLRPQPEIILVGDDEGVAEVCKEFGLVHVAEIEKNEYGTPLVNSIFRICQKRATHSVLCYVNSDIILMSNFMPAVATICSHMPKYLMTGQRWDVEIKNVLDFASDAWETDLDLVRAQTGSLQSESAMDYFVFPRGLYTDIPPLAIGRLAWDNWLVWRARSTFTPVVDATAAVTIVHQDHDYAAGTIQKLGGQRSGVGNPEDSASPLRKLGDVWVKMGPEAERNDALVSKDARQFGMWAATWMLDRQGALRRRPFSSTLAYLKHQLKWIVSMRWPWFGKLYRSLGAARRAIRAETARLVSRS